MSDQLVMNHSPDLPRISLFFPVLSTISTQICHDICEEEMPGFEYFGTQWSVEVRARIRVWKQQRFNSLQPSGIHESSIVVRLLLAQSVSPDEPTQHPVCSSSLPPSLPLHSASAP